MGKGNKHDPMKAPKSGVEKTVRKLQQGKGTKNASPPKPNKGGRRGQ